MNPEDKQHLLLFLLYWCSSNIKHRASHLFVSLETVFFFLLLLPPTCAQSPLAKSSGQSAKSFIQSLYTLNYKLDQNNSNHTLKNTEITHKIDVLNLTATLKGWVNHDRRVKVSTDPHILFKYFMSVLSLNNHVLKLATLLDPSSSGFLQTGTSWWVKSDLLYLERLCTRRCPLCIVEWKNVFFPNAIQFILSTFYVFLDSIFFFLLFSSSFDVLFIEIEQVDFHF